MSMITFTKEIWRVMDILVFMSREMGRSVMDVEFFISKTGILNFLFPDLKWMSSSDFGFMHQTHTSKSHIYEFF
jgi:hypothetical protein